MKTGSSILKIIKGKKGMTLVETVVTFIIAGILIASTGALIITGLNMYQDTAARNLDKQIGDSVLEIVSGKLQYAKTIQQGPNTSPIFIDEIGTQAALFVGIDESSPQDRGYLYAKDQGEGKTFQEVYSKDFYSGRQIEMQLKVDKVALPKAITLSIKIMDGDDIKYQRSTSFQLLNSGINDDPLTTGEWFPYTMITYTTVE